MIKHGQAGAEGMGSALTSTSDPVVGRLAPSPSARMHIGNIFSSLIAWICAKRAGGRIVLRIEDLDRARCKRTYADDIMRDYERLGLFWDNETVVWQGDRTAAYEEAFETLSKRGLLYPCFCSRADLHAASAPHRGEKYIYAGTCRGLSDTERRVRAVDRSPAWRLSVKDAPPIAFDDLFQGTYRQELPTDCGDFIVRRSDGIFAYQLAVVIDDLYQGVNQVVRGCDLLDSAPQQIYLRRLLAPDAPIYTYGHVPLFVDRAGRRLSKRDADVNVDGLLARYGSVEALYGALAGATRLLTTSAPATLDELVETADLTALAGTTRIIWNDES